MIPSKDLRKLFLNLLITIPLLLLKLRDVDDVTTVYHRCCDDAFKYFAYDRFK